ncbi:MAG: GNAT family N-acetyltransferase [Bacteroidia bacterium]|nr:GNAT family N-acetyltransferase [Bacteroidia bacterium]MBP9689028.1 GNAT family N-acetyltransferase [Bacteroidia bacterium]
MITCIRTDSSNQDFKKLVTELDAELRIRDGDESEFYEQFNKSDSIKYAIVAYQNNEPIACGALRPYNENTIEIKRMYVPLAHRSVGVATIIVKELEKWAAELGYFSLILETGIRQPEAIRLYTKNGYVSTPNYGQYAGVASSVCFSKQLPPNK